MEELTDVIARPAFAKQLALIGKTAQKGITDHLDVVKLFLSRSQIHKINRDPDDQLSRLRPKPPLKHVVAHDLYPPSWARDFVCTRL
jgi:hypothetical protein